jgi:A/G-specific adenine glycosylase
MPHPGSCGELREMLEMARTLLHHIELDIRDTEYTLRVDHRGFVREHYECLRMRRAEVEGEVRELIRPLGMEHRRARQIMELARVLVQRFGGRVPCSREMLKELPGVGDYIASEVLLRACGQAEPLLDRNTVRVVERVFGARSARRNPYRDPAMCSLARSLVPEDPELAEKFSFGVFDLARKVCTVKRPECGTCPIRDLCSYSARPRER